MARSRSERERRAMFYKLFGGKSASEGSGGKGGGNKGKDGSSKYAAFNRLFTAGGSDERKRREENRKRAGRAGYNPGAPDPEWEATNKKKKRRSTVKKGQNIPSGAMEPEFELPKISEEQYKKILARAQKREDWIKSQSVKYAIAKLEERRQKRMQEVMDKLRGVEKPYKYREFDKGPERQYEPGIYRFGDYQDKKERRKGSGIVLPPVQLRHGEEKVVTDPHQIVYFRDKAKYAREEMQQTGLDVGHYMMTVGNAEIAPKSGLSLFKRGHKRTFAEQRRTVDPKKRVTQDDLTTGFYKTTLSSKLSPRIPTREEKQKSFLEAFPTKITKHGLKQGFEENLQSKPGHDQKLRDLTERLANKMEKEGKSIYDLSTRRVPAAKYVSLGNERSPAVPYREFSPPDLSVRTRGDAIIVDRYTGAVVPPKKRDPKELYIGRFSEPKQTLSEIERWKPPADYTPNVVKDAWKYDIPANWRPTKFWDIIKWNNPNLTTQERYAIYIKSLEAQEKALGPWKLTEKGDWVRNTSKEKLTEAEYQTWLAQQDKQKEKQSAKSFLRSVMRTRAGKTANPDLLARQTMKDYLKQKQETASLISKKRQEFRQRMEQLHNKARKRQQEFYAKATPWERTKMKIKRYFITAPSRRVFDLRRDKRHKLSDREIEKLALRNLRPLDRERVRL